MSPSQRLELPCSVSNCLDALTGTGMTLISLIEFGIISPTSFAKRTPLYVVNGHQNSLTGHLSMLLLG